MKRRGGARGGGEAHSVIVRFLFVVAERSGRGHATFSTRGGHTPQPHRQRGAHTQNSKSSSNLVLGDDLKMRRQSARHPPLLGILLVASLCVAPAHASTPPPVSTEGSRRSRACADVQSLTIIGAPKKRAWQRELQSGSSLPMMAGRAGRPADLVAMGIGGSDSGWKAAGGVAGLALASEVLQVVNTFVAVFVLNRVTGASSLADLVEAFAKVFSSLGLLAYPCYAFLLHLITILPLMSAILFIVLAGTVFGPIKGTVMVSLSLSSAAAISATMSRRIAASKQYTLAKIDARAEAVDAAIAKKSWHTSLLLVTLLRLSPILPFTFSNYLAGITSIPIPVFFLGTLLGTLPTQAVYVAAGSLGRRALQGGVKLPWPVAALGVAATVGAIVLIGHVATATLKSMDLEGDGKKAKKRRQRSA